MHRTNHSDVLEAQPSFQRLWNHHPLQDRRLARVLDESLEVEGERDRPSGWQEIVMATCLIAGGVLIAAAGAKGLTLAFTLAGSLLHSALPGFMRSVRIFWSGRRYAMANPAQLAWVDCWSVYLPEIQPVVARWYRITDALTHRELALLSDYIQLRSATHADAPCPKLRHNLCLPEDRPGVPA